MRLSGTFIYYLLSRVKNEITFMNAIYFSLIPLPLLKTNTSILILILHSDCDRLACSVILYVYIVCNFWTYFSNEECVVSECSLCVFRESDIAVSC